MSTEKETKPTEVTEAVAQTAEASTEAMGKTAEATLSLLDKALDVVPFLSNWPVKVGLVLFIGLLLYWIKRSFLSMLYRRALKSENTWDDSVINALRAPTTLIVWILAFEAVRQLLLREFDLGFLASLEILPGIGFIYVIAMFASGFIYGVEHTLVEQSSHKGKTLDKTTANAIAKILRLTVYILATLIALQALGVSVSGLLAFGGIGGMVIGLAAKDLLANFFGALMIYMDKPFKVGDWVRSPDREIEGTVEDIGWRVTRIRTFDKRPLYVPNSIFTTIAIENPSRMANRRIKEVIGVRYDDMSKINAITDDINQLISNHDEIDKRNTIIVNLNAFSASSVDILVYCFTKTTNWVHYHQVKQRLLLEIEAVISGHGAEIAFPTSTLHIANKSEEEQSPFE